ncbi:woronin body major protein [Exophiala viscosa]|uniref:woronin body major protein n=1 Tax=Exophiala viscosa TaxID=2486360 RepID=UPI002192FA2F|nr:woronin body major protein [Exophiala viscosa]
MCCEKANEETPWLFITTDLFFSWPMLFFLPLSPPHLLFSHRPPPPAPTTTLQPHTSILHLASCFAPFCLIAQRCILLCYLSHPQNPPKTTYNKLTLDCRKEASTTTVTRVQGEVSAAGPATQQRGREDTRFAREEVDIRSRTPGRHTERGREDIRIYEERDRDHRHGHPEVELTREKYRGPAEYSADINIDRRETRDHIEVAAESQLDITERDYRRRTNPTYDVGIDEYERRRPTAAADADINVSVSKEEIKVTDVDVANSSNKMGYYDDEGQYHSFRRGVERAADRILHPLSGGHHHTDRVIERDEVVIHDREAGPGGHTREQVRFVEPRFGGKGVPIQCHFIRVGDILLLQGRPSQVIRISMSSQTGQYRYLGVDLFTRQLHEESSFVSNPAPSVVVQTMLGPVFKQYRVLDIRDDGLIVAMTETGDVKQGLSVVDQGGLFKRIDRAFSDGRGSVRVLVINDGGRELVVDMKIIHGSRL